MTSKLKNRLNPISLILRYMCKTPLLMVITVFCLLVSSAAAIATPYLLRPIINECILPGDLEKLVMYLTILGVIYLCGTIAGYVSARILVRVSQKATCEMRRDVFAKMQRLPISYFDTHTHGELMSLYTNDIDTISNFISGSVSGVITGVISFVGILIMMLTLNPLLTLVSAVFLTAMVIVTQKSGRLSKKYFVAQQEDIAKLNGYIEEMTEGQKVVKVFNHERQAISGFSERNQELLGSSTLAQLYSGIIMPALGGIASTNLAVSCFVGVLMAIGGLFDLGSLVSYIQYLRQAGQPIAVLSLQANILLAAVAGAGRVMALFGQQDEEDQGTVRLARDGEGMYWESPDKTKIELKGDIVFDNVTFGYKSNVHVLKGVSFHAEPGQKIALVGATGSGKTTITNLLTRFYEIENGKITYDGISLDEIKKEDLRQTLCMVLQDTHLFTGSVRENILFGKPGASEEDVVAAARLAGAHFFISHLPEGYDTVLIGDGENLSQGQRQLIAIARAAIADPPVLILDEATSSIDTRTEKIIEEGMNRLMAGRTVFVIAHRLSTVRNADIILVLENGEIIEDGNHQELLNNRGKYYSLYTGHAFAHAD